MNHNVHLQVQELDSGINIQSPELRCRANRATWPQWRPKYLVYKDGQEVAFLWLTVIPDKDYILLHELWVAKERRQQGIGSAVIQEAEKIALGRGGKQLRLRPEPLSDDMSKDELTSWYGRHGFHPCAEEAGALQKEL